MKLQIKILLNRLVKGISSQRTDFQVRNVFKMLRMKFGTSPFICERSEVVLFSAVNECHSQTNLVQKGTKRIFLKN